MLNRKKISKIGFGMSALLLFLFFAIIVSTLIRPICSKDVDIESKDGIFYVYYQDKIYMNNIEKNMQWYALTKAQAEDAYVQTGWHWADIVFFVSHFSDKADNPEFIVLGHYDIAFREDFDPFAQPLTLYNPWNSESINIELCLYDLMKTTPVELPYVYHREHKVDVYDIRAYMQDHTCIYKSLDFFKYEGQYYWHLDTISDEYKKLYYPVSEDLAKEISEFYGIAFD